MSIDPELSTTLVTAAAALLMVLAGLQKRQLELRSQRRRCPRCGRRSARSCGCTTSK